MGQTKQVLVVRKDLKMRKGKIAAQCAHASMKVFIDRDPLWNYENRMRSGESPRSNLLSIPLSGDMIDWLEGSFTKVCVSVDSEEELMEIFEKAKAAYLHTALIVDSGRTEFNGVPTKTVVAIGPGPAEEIDKITGELKLL